MTSTNNRYKAARTAKGLSQEDVSKASGVNERTIRKLENDEKVSLRTVRRVCEAIGLTYDAQQPIEETNQVTDLIPKDTEEVANPKAPWWFKAFVSLIPSLLILNVFLAFAPHFFREPNDRIVNISTLAYPTIRRGVLVETPDFIVVEGSADFQNTPDYTATIATMRFRIVPKFCPPLFPCIKLDEAISQFTDSILKLDPEADVTIEMDPDQNTRTSGGDRNVPSSLGMSS